jgi:DNA-binding NarL/FixJ family response regulator
MDTTLRALLIEDSQADATLIKISLSECIKPMIHVDHRTTMCQGLEFLTTQTGIDVVLLDLSLPDAIGEQTVTMVREAAPNLPIVIMTGHDDPEYAEKMLSLGAQDYIVKGSFDGSMVSRAIRYAITRMQQSIERDVILAELREAVDLKNRMLGILAHDLRNPLGAILGWVELVEMLEGDKISEW